MGEWETGFEDYSHRNFQASLFPLGLRQGQNHLEPALQASRASWGGLRLLSQQPGSLSDRERQISSFNNKKKLWQVLYNQMQTKDIGRQRRKNPAGGHHHAGSWGFLVPLHDSSGRVWAYCSLNMRPAWGPSDSGCARGQCGHCTPRTCEGSQGDIKMNICV